MLVLALSRRDLRPGEAELEWHLDYVARMEVRSELPDLHLILKAKMASCFYFIRMHVSSMKRVGGLGEVLVIKQLLYLSMTD